MKLYCLRHGETNYNRLGLCNDDPARDVHLTDRGKQQARQAAEQLEQAPLECLFVSELPRTLETAHIINAHHRVPIIAIPALNDIRSGFDGQPVADYFSATGHDRLHMRANGGESLLDYKTRVNGFLDMLVQRQEQCVAVVAHEETLRVFACHFRHLPDEKMEQLHFGNCEIVAFEL